MNAETDNIIKNIDLMLAAQLKMPGLSDKAKKEMAAQWIQLKHDYKQALVIEKDNRASDRQREQAKKVCESLAKGLPEMTRATISAADAFKRGDPISGSASVMNICAAAAPILGTTLGLISAIGAAGGPAGALVGALFSVIGQILMIFGPKTESMYDKIEKLLTDLKQQDKLENIETAHTLVLNHARALRAATKTLVLNMRQDASDPNYTANLGKAIDAFRIVVADQNPVEGNTLHGFTSIMSWLKSPEAQDLDRWPEVLGVWCKSYTDFVTSTQTVVMFAHSSELWDKARNAGPTVTEKLNNLLSLVAARQDEYAACHTQAFQDLQKITPVARNRGLFFILDGNDVFVGTGKAVIAKSKWNHVYGNTRRMSLAQSKLDILQGNLNPTYDLWTLEQEHYNAGEPGKPYKALLHIKLESRKMATAKANEGAHHKIVWNDANLYKDIWAIPSPDNISNYYVYCTLSPELEQPAALQLHEVTPNGKEPGWESFTRINWLPDTKFRSPQIRVITPPPMTLLDDPDRDSMPEMLLGGVEHYNSIFYGMLEAGDPQHPGKSASEIYVDRANERCFIRAPWDSYSGIAVDPYMLWVYNATGFTCATHASVMASIKSNGAVPPRWYKLEAKGGFIPSDAKLINFYPCEDDTLFFTTDKKNLFTAVYRADHKTQTIHIEAPTKFSGYRDDIKEVQKLPIPCWEVFQSLKMDLSNKTNKAEDKITSLYKIASNFDKSLERETEMA